MRQHIGDLNAARTAKTDERVALVQALFDLMPDTPVLPCVMRDRLAELWAECYGELLDRKQAWNHLRSARRRGKVAQTDEGLYYPRKSRTA